MLLFCEVTNQIAANHDDSGVRVRWKIVPAVSEVFRPQSGHIHRPRPVRHASRPPHAGQTNPVRPPHRGQVLQARRIVGEPRQQIPVRPRIVNPADRMTLRRSVHAQNLQSIYPEHKFD
jgi:hypothetical protein